MFKAQLVRKTIMFAIAATLAATAATGAMANTRWQNHHPRRAEVNSRLHHQDRRINREVRDGQISRGQAARLHREDRQIRGEERSMASQDGGHITRQEDRTLNQQENRVSQQIGR